MAQHLLVAADRFALPRLRRICERRLCETVEVGVLPPSPGISSLLTPILLHHVFHLLMLILASPLKRILYACVLICTCRTSCPGQFVICPVLLAGEQVIPLQLSLHLMTVEGGVDAPLNDCKATVDPRRVWESQKSMARGRSSGALHVCVFGSHNVMIGLTRQVR